MGGSSSDEPIIVSSHSVRTTSEAGPSRPRSRVPSRPPPLKSEYIEVNSGDEDDDDDPVFVGAKIGASLKDKFAFKAEPIVPSISSARARSIASSSDRKGKSKAKDEFKVAKDEDKLMATDLLRHHSPPQLATSLPPAWLGKTAVLLKTSGCMLCKRDWKKSENGAQRWRHLSTCLPPLFRPPNPPPDLQALVSEALVDALGPEGPTSLLDLHVRTQADVFDNRFDLPPGNQELSPDKGKRSSKGKPTTTKNAKKKTTQHPMLLNITTVKAAGERGDTWDLEVEDRVRNVLGHSSPPREPHAGLAPPSSPGFSLPPTQPLGESNLASAYARNGGMDSPSASPQTPERLVSPEPRHSSSPSDPVSLRDEMPMPPASQNKTTLSDDHESDGESGVDEADDYSPFRRRGGSRPSGDLPAKRRLGFGLHAQTLFSSQSASQSYRNTSPAPSSPVTVADISPNTTISSTYSVTPRNLFIRHSRSRDFTPTPIELALRNRLTSPAPSKLSRRPQLMIELGDSDSDSGSGSDNTIAIDLSRIDDEAIMRWDGIEDDTGDDVSSVPAEEAGVLSDSEDDEDPEEWGKGAVLDFTLDSPDEAPPKPLSSDEEVDDDVEDKKEDEDGMVIETEPNAQSYMEREESKADLVARGMPDYDLWEDTKLQRLTTGYGYRPITQRAGLIKIAIECWKAINPAPQRPPHRPVVKSNPIAKSKSKPVPKASEESDSSITSADIPLANKQKSKATSKGKGKGKAKQKEDVAEPEPVDIDKRLYEMIMGNEALYIRILRYEPISFDELISMAIAAGIKGKKWKLRLKQFLDFQGITFYTEDLTGQRRRR